MTEPLGEHTTRHLEMIQSVVSRMAGNSFAIKTWAVTLVAALFALGTRESKPSFFLVALLPTFTFWGLDAYFLRRERLFRYLFDAVREGRHVSSHAFSMDVTPYESKTRGWAATLKASTVVWLYGSIAVLIVMVAVVAYGVPQN